MRVLGTPTPAMWPELEGLPLYKKNWPHYQKRVGCHYLFSMTGKSEFDILYPQPFSHFSPRLDAEGHAFLEQMIVYVSQSRITSIEALHHPYFLSLPKEVYEIDDCKSSSKSWPFFW